MITPFSRRTFLKSAGIAAAGVPAGALGMSADSLRARIALSDLHYDTPASRSEEGIPIGNGRMGSLVWTTPSQLRLQINRVDVYSSNSASNSFSEAHNDYCGGCAFLDIRFDGQPFAAGKVAQHLSVYDGMLSIAGDGVTVEIVADRTRDVFAIAIRDRRYRPRAPVAVLRALRFDPKFAGMNVRADGQASVFRTKSHLAITRLEADADAIVLSQEFREGAFVCRSAVMAGFAEAAAGEVTSETDVALTGSEGDSTTLFIASAASLETEADGVAQARAVLDAARADSWNAIARATRAWWHGFWERGWVELRSGDGVAQRLQRDYHYFLYLMASASRGGKYPPKFNGMLWNTGGDLRAWGAQHWYVNTSCYYEALPASGRFELMDPFFDMYSAMLPACEAAAKAQWDSQGIFIPETVYFDGPEALPPTIAAEMRDLYLSREPWAKRSAEFLAFAATKHPYASAWNWKTPGKWENGRYIVSERGAGPYGPTSHIFAATAKIAWHFWLRYDFTRDREWLERRAYPMLRGAVEFYRHHPMTKLGADGRFHIQGSNNGEPIRGARDPNEDLSALRAVIPALLRASALLDKDADLRAAWTTFLDRLAPLPASDDPDVLGAEALRGPRTLAAARAPAAFVANPAYLRAEPNSLPTWFFDLCGVEARDQELRALAGATFDAQLAIHGPASPVWNNGLTKLPIAAATLGRADAVRDLVPRQMGGLAGTTELANTPLLRNRMSLGEGPQALNAQHLGRASEALQLALLQSAGLAPAEEPILHLFPAWPREWDASYTLHTRGGFVVEAAIRAGKVQRLRLRSSAGSTCRLRNPFADPVTLNRDGRPAETLTGTLLDFPTRAGEVIDLIPEN